MFPNLQFEVGTFLQQCRDFLRNHLFLDISWRRHPSRLVENFTVRGPYAGLMAPSTGFSNTSSRWHVLGKHPQLRSSGMVSPFAEDVQLATVPRTQIDSFSLCRFPVPVMSWHHL